MIVGGVGRKCLDYVVTEDRTEQQNKADLTKGWHKEWVMLVNYHFTCQPWKLFVDLPFSVRYPIIILYYFFPTIDPVFRPVTVNWTSPTQQRPNTSMVIISLSWVALNGRNRNFRTRRLLRDIQWTLPQNQGLTFKHCLILLVLLFSISFHWAKHNNSNNSECMQNRFNARIM